MRCCRTFLALLLLATLAAGQEFTTNARYEVAEDLLKFPQKTPQEAMKSVAKALEARDVEYVLAHLTDPAYVDGKIKEYSKLYKGPPKSVELVAFQHLVKEVGKHFLEDPALPEELRRFAKDGVWEVDVKSGKASAKLPDLASRRVYLIFAKATAGAKEGRWYLQNQR